MVYSKTRADRYLSALEREAAAYKASFNAKSFGTVYIGGGTPTVCSEAQLRALIRVIRQTFTIEADAEWTIEANPNSVSRSFLSTVRQLGINRLSLGIQSFSDAVLAFLERPHTAEEAFAAFHAARQAGFDNIGMDLIYGIPGQSMEQWRETLDTAIRLGPEHLSLYSLSLDEGSRLKTESEAGTVALPDDEWVAAQYEHAVVFLQSKGYEQYELSNFCLPGRACRHNAHYWQRGEYLGLGPGAWSFLSGRRYRTAPDLEDYCTRLESGLSPLRDGEKPDETQASAETVMLALRTMQGLELARYEQRFGQAWSDALKDKAGPLIRDGLMELEHGRLRLSRRGFLIANELILRLCP